MRKLDRTQTHAPSLVQIAVAPFAGFLAVAARQNLAMTREYPWTAICDPCQHNINVRLSL